MSDGSLIVAATPIGNLGDISDRLRESLAGASVVYAEDTRRAAKLLSHVGVHPKVRSLFVGNERARTDELISDLESGLTVVLISDAGMPTVSDPGAEAIRAARSGGHAIAVLPGPSAVTTAMTLSGFGGDRFVFEGFLPRKGRERRSRLDGLVHEERPAVLFASPRRLRQDLVDLEELLGGGRQVAVCRELTKLHEEVWVGSLDEAVDVWQAGARGEVTLVIEGAKPQVSSLDDAIGLAVELVEGGSSASDAARDAAGRTGVSRREIYQALLDAQESS